MCVRLRKMDWNTLYHTSSPSWDYSTDFFVVAVLCGWVVGVHGLKLFVKSESDIVTWKEQGVEPTYVTECTAGFWWNSIGSLLLVLLGSLSPAISHSLHGTGITSCYSIILSESCMCWAVIFWYWVCLVVLFARFLFVNLFVRWRRRSYMVLLMYEEASIELK